MPGILRKLKRKHKLDAWIPNPLKTVIVLPWRIWREEQCLCYDNLKIIGIQDFSNSWNRSWIWGNTDFPVMRICRKNSPYLLQVKSQLVTSGYESFPRLVAWVMYQGNFIGLVISHTLWIITSPYEGPIVTSTETCAFLTGLPTTWALQLIMSHHKSLDELLPTQWAQKSRNS